MEIVKKEIKIMSCILGIDKQGWILRILWVVRVSHFVVLFWLAGGYTG